MERQRFITSPGKTVTPLKKMPSGPDATQVEQKFMEGEIGVSRSLIVDS
jgi:hypothetical protein